MNGAAGGVPDVRFILLEKREKALSLCRLAEHYFNAGHKILIHVQDADQAQALDRYLWTWSKGSFLPHACAEDSADEPIVVTTTEDNLNDAAVLIMGAPCTLVFMSRFQLVIDFAEVYDPAFAQLSRDRFRRYRDSGFNPRLS